MNSFKYLSFIVVVLTMLVSCTNSSQDNANKLPTDSIKIDKPIEEFDNKIPIIIALTHPDELQFASPMRYMCQTSDDSIIVYPSSYNFNGFYSGKKYEVPQNAIFDASEDVEYLCFDAFITNISNEIISIEKLLLDVAESQIDTNPYLYICTIEDKANTLIISDESWTNYGGFALEYSLLKKGEKFNGVYTQKKIFSKPGEYMEIDFTDDLKNMGYSYGSLKNKYGCPEEEYIVITSIDYSGDPSKLFYPFEWEELQEGQFSYYLGFCRLQGKITFFNGFKPVEFSARLSLSCRGDFGAGLDYNDHFDFCINTDGNNYQIIKPYITTLSPQSTEKISLKIKCSKSSFHKFTLRAISDTDIEISSKPVSLHFMMPKHAVQSDPL